MSMILDIIVIAVIIITALVYWKRGLIKSLVGIAGFFLSLWIAFIFFKKLGEIVKPLIADKVDSVETGESILGKLAGKIIDSTVISNAIAFGLLFILSLLVFKLIALLISAIFELPILKQANHLAGAILGICLGFLYAELLSIILFCLSEVLIGSVSWITVDVYDKSIIAKWLFQHNLFSYIIH